MRGCRRTITIALGVLFISLIVSTGVIYGYWYRGKQLADQAWEAYYEGRPDEALATYEVLNRQYPISWGPFEDITIHARYLVPELKDYIQTTEPYTEGQRKEAIIAYESFLNEHFSYSWGTNLYLSRAREAVVNLMIDEARYLYKQGDYHNSLDIYETLLDFKVHGGCVPEGDYDLWGNACQHADEVTEQLKSQAREDIPQIFTSWQNDHKWKQEIQVFILQFQTITNRQPGVISPEIASNTLETAYSVWAAEISNNDQYESAIEDFRKAIESYPPGLNREPVEEILAGIYINWADRLRGNEMYEEAIDKYKLILSEFPANRYGSIVKDEMAETYAAWANELRQEAKYKEAIDKYQQILNELPNTSIAEEINRLITETQAEYETWRENTKAIYVVNFPPEVSPDEEGKWIWTTTFEEAGGQIGYTLSGEGWIIDKNGDKWGPWGFSIDRGPVEVPPGGKGEDTYWLRGDQFIDGYAEFLWQGEDENGHQIEIIERIHLLP